MKLVLHIGPFKTGTSAIQNALYSQASALAEHGVHTPVFGGAFGQHAVRGWPALDLPDKAIADPLLDLPWPDVTAAHALSRSFWETLADDVARLKPEVLCLSSEFLSILTDVERFHARLTALSGTLETVVSAYVRGPRSLYVSNLQQQIRGGRGLADVILPSGRGAFQQQVLSRFETVFGRESLRVRHFHRDNLVDGDVVSDFWALLEQVAPQGVPPCPAREPANESLTGAAVAWLLSVNEGLAAHVPAQRRLAMVQWLLNDPEVRALPRLELTDPVLTAAIDARSRTEIQWVNETFLQGQVPLPSGHGAVVLSPKAARQRIRTWLMSHMTPKAMEVITASLARLPQNR